MFSKLKSRLTLGLTGASTTQTFPGWFRIVLYGAFTAGFCSMLPVLVRSRPAVSTVTTVANADRDAFETGYFLRAHDQLCTRAADENAAALARQLEMELRGRATASEKYLLAGECSLASGSEVRRRMPVRAATYELLGETAFDAEGVKDTLPPPMVAVLSDVASTLRDTPAPASLVEFENGNRDADLLHRRLFEGAELPFHNEIRAQQQQRLSR